MRRESPSLRGNASRFPAMTPTQRSLAKLRAEGWTVAVVERWNPYAKIRQDLFGFIDLIALRGDETLAVQTTSGPNVAARIDKIRGTQAAAIWLESPTRKIAVHGWAKRGERGKRKAWDCREVFVTPPLAETPSNPTSALFLIEREGKYWACGGKYWLKAGAAHTLTFQAATRIAGTIPGARIVRTTERAETDY